MAWQGTSGFIPSRLTVQHVPRTTYTYDACYSDTHMMQSLVCQPVLRERVAYEVLELSDALGLWRRLPEGIQQCVERVLVLWELLCLYMLLFIVSC